METRDLQGWTAIYHATSSGHQNMVLYLIESGADINVKLVFGGGDGGGAGDGGAGGGDGSGGGSGSDCSGGVIAVPIT